MAQAEPQVSFGPFEGPQREFWNDTTREVLLSSGWGAGKTRIGLEKADYYARRYAPTKCLITRKVNADLPGSTLEELFSNVLPETHIVQIHKDEQWVEVSGEDGTSKIYWTGMDRREKVGSTEFGYIFGDEAYEFDHEEWTWLRGRLRISNVGFHQLVGATNPPPDGQSHWMYGYFFEDAERSVYHLNPLNNPHLDADYKDDLDRLGGILRRRFLDGEWVAGGGTWLKREMIDFVHANDLPEGREFQWIVTADLGLEADPEKAEEKDTDYWAAAIFAYDGVRKEGYLIDVTRTRGMTKDQGVGWLQAIMDGVPTNQVGIEATQAQRWFVQDAKNAGLNAYGIEHDRKKENRLMYLSVPFTNGTVRLVNHDDPEHREKGVDHDPRWDAFISEWTSFPNGNHDDLLDAVDMAISQADLGGVGAMTSGDAYSGGGGSQGGSDTWRGMQRK